jgi:hypothetical protein
MAFDRELRILGSNLVTILAIAGRREPRVARISTTTDSCTTPLLVETPLVTGTEIRRMIPMNIKRTGTSLTHSINTPTVTRRRG